MARGGPQRHRVPKPEVVHPLGAPSWASLPAEERHVDLDRVRRALAAAPLPGLPAALEGKTVAFAAVLLALFEEDGEAWLVLTRRAAHMRRNAGDIAYPGGRVDPGETFVQTAAREAFEEIGLDPSSLEVLGELDHGLTLNGIEMVPIVAALAGRPTDLVASPGEVDAILVVPLAELLDDAHYRGERWDDDRHMHEFDLEGDTIWGATARILHRFLELLLAVPPSR